MDLAHAAPRFLPPRAAPPPSRLDALWFDVRASGHRLRRALVEIGNRPARHRVGEALASAPVVGEFASPLWPAAETETALVAGKIHNLRVARRRLHGIEVPAGATFSFWRQLGRADARAGYVAGRELREGCLVPAVGGGLCQLTNALYVAALGAGLEIVERHRHSRVIPGSLAEIDRDATVFWNYLDLRLRASTAWRIEIDLDAERLVVRLRGLATPARDTAPRPPTRRAATPERQAGAPTGDCTSCDQHACHRYTGSRALRVAQAWLLDPASPITMAARTLMSSEDRDVAADAAAHGQTARGSLTYGPLAQWLRRALAAVRRRWARARGATHAGLALGERERHARALAARLRPDDVRVVVAQGLLPFLWRDGVLAGRRFDVLMDALPMAELQQRLDAAAARHPDAASLRDFRAPPLLIEHERAALAAADGWIAAHAQILALAGPRARLLSWPAARPFGPATITPSPHDRDARDDDAPLRVLFPASSLARKGALELRAALHGLPMRVLLPPGARETPDFWHDTDAAPVASIAAGLATADVVVLPAWVEHQPSALLAAIAAGVPVIATAACGLAPSPAWTCVPEGDVEALRAALVATRRRVRARRAGSAA